MNILLQLSENDKRFLFVILLVFILVFVLIGYIGMLIVRVMKRQGKKLDSYVAPVVKLKVITDKKKFKKYARKKNWIIFYKQARIPVLILLVGVLILIVRNAIVGNFAYNPFHQPYWVDTGFVDDLGNPIMELHSKSFSSLLWIWEWKIVIKEGTLSIPPIKCIHNPEFVPEAIPSYLFVLSLLVGGLWYLYTVQAFIAREIRIRKLSDTVFSINLDNYSQIDDTANSLNQQVNQNPNPQNPSDINNINL